MERINGEIAELAEQVDFPVIAFFTSLFLILQQLA